MVGGSQPVESSLHKHLVEHLNSEVVLHTITDLSVAMQWLASTFLYIRARRNPKHYGLPTGLASNQLDKKLLDICQIEINKLCRYGMLTLDHNINITPTNKGCLMAKYYVDFETMKIFDQLTGFEIMQQILSFVSKCHEFSDMYLRVNDKKTLNLLNKCRHKETIRFPLNGKIKTLDMKINCIIQAVLGSLPISEFSLLTEAEKIMRISERITNCLTEYFETKNNCYSALLNTVILKKCFHVKLWENSPYISKQFPGIGTILSKNLVQAGKKTFQSLLDANPRDLERILNRKPPAGNDLQELIKYLPKYKISIEKQNENGVISINLLLQLTNASDMKQKMTVDENSYMTLIVGDDENKILLHEKYKHSYMVINDEMEHFMELNNSKIVEIRAHLISEDWVGFDCQVTLNLLENHPEKETSECCEEEPVQIKNKESRQEIVSKGRSNHIKQFMDVYFKSVKKRKEAIKKTPPSKLKSKKVVQQNLSKVFKNISENTNKSKVNDFLKKIDQDLNVNCLNTTSKDLVCKHFENKEESTSVQSNINNTNDNEEKKSCFESNTSFSITQNVNQVCAKDKLNEFRCKIPPKFSHGSIPEKQKTVTPDSTSEKTYKIIEILEPVKQHVSIPTNQKSLRWGSPLASVSYIIPSPNTSLSNTSNSPGQSPKDRKFEKVTNRSSRILNKRLDSENFHKYFPLTDKECSTQQEESINKSEIKDDIISTMFLEQLGFNALSYGNKKQENTDTEIKLNVSTPKVTHNLDASNYAIFLSSQIFPSKIQTSHKLNSPIQTTNQNFFDINKENSNQTTMTAATKNTVIEDFGKKYKNIEKLNTTNQVENKLNYDAFERNLPFQFQNIGKQCENTNYIQQELPIIQIKQGTIPNKVYDGRRIPLQTNNILNEQSNLFEPQKQFVHIENEENKKFHNVSQNVEDFCFGNSFCSNKRHDFKSSNQNLLNFRNKSNSNRYNTSIFEEPEYNFDEINEIPIRSVTPNVKLPKENTFQQNEIQMYDILPSNERLNRINNISEPYHFFNANRTLTNSNLMLNSDAFPPKLFMPQNKFLDARSINMERIGQIPSERNLYEYNLSNQYNQARINVPRFYSPDNPPPTYREDFRKRAFSQAFPNCNENYEPFRTFNERQNPPTTNPYRQNPFLETNLQPNYQTIPFTTFCGSQNPNYSLFSNQIPFNSRNNQNIIDSYAMRPIYNEHNKIPQNSFINQMNAQEDYGRSRNVDYMTPDDKNYLFRKYFQSFNKD